MKAKFRYDTYNLLDSGISNYSNKLILSIIKGNNSFEEIKSNCKDNSEIIILDDNDNIIQKFIGYAELADIIQDDNVVIVPPKYDKDGVIIDKEIQDSVVVVTLKNDGSEEQEEPQDETDELGELKKQLEDNTAKIDYLLMLLEWGNINE